MLIINRVKVSILTENGEYGADMQFSSGLNLIASDDNTSGKSSTLEAIYYCLGLEEIIGGRGEKVLTSVYKTAIEDNEKIWSVLESGAYLEISNGLEVITIYRSAHMENRESRLLTVYYSSMDQLNSPDVLKEDMYVHFPNAAVNEKGFHAFLENFLHMQLPLVPTSDDAERKLYLQVIFSSMFIEQKHGWSGIFSGMPILGIKESKKRVVEYVLGLNTIDNERKKSLLKVTRTNIENQWKDLYQHIINATSKENCRVVSWPAVPSIMRTEDIDRIQVATLDNHSIDERISQLSREYDSLLVKQPKIADNFEQLQTELQATESAILELETKIKELSQKKSIDAHATQRLTNSLEFINSDIRNNKDAARLRDLGSNMQGVSFDGVCPVCNQEIHDSLLPSQSDFPIMSIDENIRHLDAQKKMVTFALDAHNENVKRLEAQISDLESRLFSLRRIATALRSDLFSVNDDYSETIVYKKIELENQKQSLENLAFTISSDINELKRLSKEWEKYLSDNSKLPKKKYTDDDTDKLSTLRSNFIKNAKKYGYKSVQDLSLVEISEESYLPTVEKFDMKFDSSASDNIRVIWAYTMSLLQTSLATKGNHPTVLIFDEPNQHSIIPNDMKAFFDSILSLGTACQVIIGITVKDTDTSSIIDGIEPEKCNIVRIHNRAFTLLTPKDKQVWDDE